MLGAEDAGLPAPVVRACHYCVSLEGVRAASYNVSVAGTLVMYDRQQKLRPATSNLGLEKMHDEMVASQGATDITAPDSDTAKAHPDNGLVQMHAP